MGGRARGFTGSDCGTGRKYLGSDLGHGYRDRREDGHNRGVNPSPQIASKSEPAMQLNLKKQFKNEFKPGNAGQPIDLIANFFKLTTGDISYFYYDVTITKFMFKFEVDDPKYEEKMKKNQLFLRKFSSVIIEKFVSDNRDLFQDIRYVFDGLANLYTVRKLKFQESFTSKVIVDIDGPSEFVVKLVLVDQIDLSEVHDFYQGKINYLSERTVSVFEIFFRFLFGEKYEVFQRKYFDLSTSSRSPKVRYIDFVSGFTSSVRVIQAGLALNVHLKTSAIISQTMNNLYKLANRVSQICVGVKPDRNQLEDLNKIVRKLKIITVHTRRGKLPYTIEEIIPETPKERIITETQETIANYFWRVYKIRLQQLPLVRVLFKKKIHFIPMELCRLVSNQFLSNTKIDANIQSELLFKSSHLPTDYFNKLDGILKKVVRLDLDLQRQFGIKLSIQPITLKGRVLDKPRTLNSRDKFYLPKNSPAKWGVFCFDQKISYKELKVFVNRMIARGKNFGMKFSLPNPVDVFVIKNKKGLKNAFYNLNSKTQAEFIFVGLPEYHELDELYKLTKHYCDQQYGIMSQCFKSEYIINTPKGYFDNFLQKVNCKLGGANWVISPMLLEKLPFKPTRTMLVGVDVNHPGVTEKVESSISAAVGSYDPLFTKYNASIRVQPKEGQELVKQIDQMILELLTEFKKNNKLFPENLIIFRDGVSEGMLDKVEKDEIRPIQNVFKKIDKQIKLTYIITQKRHHTRFILTKKTTFGRETSSFNVPSGTIVDTTIVEPNLKVFYLNSHFSPLGTSKPTKYIILRDDLNLSTDDIQKLCFYACYNSNRTRNVISIPTPVRYADLCAYRAKLHVDAQNKLGNDSELEIVARLNAHIKVSDALKNRFYYC